MQAMNGFQLTADSYRKAAERGKISKDYADKEYKVLDFLATCDDADVCNMFDSPAFNKIANSYLYLRIAHGAYGQGNY